MNLQPSRPYWQSTFSTEEFRDRRRRVCDSIGDAVALLPGLAASRAMDVFRQHNDFFYLCGVEVPHAYLLLDGKTHKSILYLLPQDERQAERDGPEWNAGQAEMAVKWIGVDEVRPIAAILKDLSSTTSIFLCRQAPEGRQVCQDSLREAQTRWQQDPCRLPWPTEPWLVESLRKRLGPLDVQDLSPMLREMRRLKSPAELKVMRQAGELTALATAEAMRCTRPGIIESDLAAVAEFIFRCHGAQGPGYRPIVASGPNVWNMHYYRNDRVVADGDWVLFDFAPDLAYYTSDIGRMWPVNGRYAAWQRELYGLVVDYHLTLLPLIQPGKTPRQIRSEAKTCLQSRVSKTRWSHPDFEDAAQKLLDTSLAMTHNVGMAVHDEGGYQDDDRELEPGLVFALDPQLWVPSQRIYARVEDTVAITETGSDNFTASVAHEADQIEALMQEPGVLQLRPDLLPRGPGFIR